MRTPLDPLRGPQSVSPVANPVNTYNGIPRLQAPALRTIQDLSPLSGALSDLARAMIPGARQEQKDEASQFFAENKAAISAAGSTGDVESLVAKTLKGQQSPLFYKSLYTQAGASLASLYQGQLQTELDKFTRISDQSGLLQEPAETVDQIQARVSKDILGHPLMTDFYARTAFADAKAQIDEQFTTTAVTQRGAALEAYQKQQAAQGIGLDLEGYLTAGSAKDGKAHLDSLDIRISDLYKIYGTEARGIYWAATESSVRAMAAVDPQKALEMIDLAAGVKVGDADLGGDVRYQAQVAELRKRVLDQRDAEVSRDASKLQAAKAETSLKLDRDFIPKLHAAWEAGENLETVRQNLEAGLPSAFGEWAGFARQELFDQTRALQSRSPSTPNVVAEIEALSKTDPAAADAMLKSSISTGDVKGAEVSRLTAVVAKGKDLDHFLQDGTYRSVKDSFNAFQPAPGMGEEYTQGATQTYLDKIKTFEREYLDFAQANQSDPAAVQKWLTTKQDQIQSELGQAKLTVAKERNLILDTIDTALTKGKSVKTLIDDGARKGLLTQDQQRAYTLKNLEALTFDNFLNDPEVQKIERGMLRKVETLARYGGDALGLQDQIDKMMSEFKTKGRDTLGQMANDDKVTAEDMQRAWRTETEKFAQEATKVLRDFDKQAQEQATAEGNVEGALQHSRSLDIWRADQAESLVFPAALPKAFVNEDVSAASAGPRALGKTFSYDFYSLYTGAVRLVQRKDSQAPGAIAEMRSASAKTLAKILTNERLDDGKRAEAVSSILGLTGTTPEILLKGSVTTGVGEITLNPSLVNPLITPMFQTQAELRAWAQTPQINDLMRKYGMNPDSPQDTARFVASQALAIKRLNPNG